jgi:hypothetical protein
MSNKQSSIEYLAIQLWEHMNMQGDGEIVNKILEQAKAMHKEEIIYATEVGYTNGYLNKEYDGHQHYNETFGENNEQH